MPLNDGAILKSLTKIADRISSQARQNAPTSKIRNNIKVGYAKPTGDGYEIDISIDLGEAPEAGAYEWGSGIHSTRGPRETYEIRPRNKSALAIPYDSWDSFDYPVKRGPKMIGAGNKGFLLRRVDHPGVEARPYMGPAIHRTLDETRRDLVSSITATFMSKRRVEVIR